MTILSLLQEILGPYQQQRDEYLFSCPFCHHHKKKLSINIATNNKSYPLSRWLAKGVDKADSYLVDKFKQLNDVRNGNKAIHQYDWRTAGNSFAGKSATAKSRIDGSPAGRAPGGING